MGARGRGLESPASEKGGAKTGPSPVDRGRRGSKHHLLVDGRGVPLAWTLTGGNRNDITQLLELLDRVPPVRGRTGRPRRRPRTLVADRGYDHDKYRRLLWQRGVKPIIARREADSVAQIERKQPPSSASAATSSVRRCSSSVTLGVLGRPPGRGTTVLGRNVGDLLDSHTVSVLLEDERSSISTALACCSKSRSRHARPRPPSEVPMTVPPRRLQGGERPEEIAVERRCDGVGDCLWRHGREGLDADHVPRHNEADDLRSDEVGAKGAVLRAE